jgi:hypothetical protein
MLFAPSRLDFLLAEPGDARYGDWSREQLMEMNDRFTSAVATAIRNRQENPASVSATIRIARSTAVVEEAAIQAAFNLLMQCEGEMAFAEIVKVVQSCCPGVTAARIRASFEQKFKEVADGRTDKAAD